MNSPEFARVLDFQGWGWIPSSSSSASSSRLPPPLARALALAIAFAAPSGEVAHCPQALLDLEAVGCDGYEEAPG